MTSPIDDFVQQNQTRFFDELLEFLRIPSISTLPEHRQDVARAAQFVADGLTRAGLENVEVVPTDKHPLVYADWLGAPGKPTVLCYGHYDVQPPDPLELWKTPPFEPNIRDGNVYARGACDDKGQMYMHIKAVEALRHVHGGKLPVNVRFLIEGEEEVGGDSISRYVPLHKQKLKADVALVSDTELFADGVPTLCIGLRGLIYLEIEARGPARDLHSGVYGGAAPNAVYGLIELLAKAKDADGHIRIPGVTDDVVPPDAAELESWRRLPFSEEEFLRDQVGSSALTGEPEQSVLERVWARPTFEVHGIAGGFASAGAKTVIPAQATAKVSLRLVPGQDFEEVGRALERAVRTAAPEWAEVRVNLLHGGNPVQVDVTAPAFEVLDQAFESVVGRKAVPVRAGGSIPIIPELGLTGAPVILTGIGLPDDGLHSPNEKLDLSQLWSGIEIFGRFFEMFARSGAGSATPRPVRSA